MLPGLRLVLAAITGTIVIVVLGFAQLVKLQVAQSHSASLGPVEARFAGLAFAERADWTPVRTHRRTSLESLAPFSSIAAVGLRADDVAGAAATASAAQSIAPADLQPLLLQEVRAPERLPLMPVAAAADATSSARMPEAASRTAAVAISIAMTPASASLPPRTKEGHVATAPREIDPVSLVPIEAAVALPADASMAYVALGPPPHAPIQVASILAEVAIDSVDAVATVELGPPAPPVMLPLPRPTLTAVSARVPLPISRPAMARSQH
jgi:hypothetical protein